MLLGGAEADEGADAFVDGVGAAVGDGGGAIEVVDLGEEGDFRVGIPGGEVVGELRHQGDGVLGEEVAGIGDDEVVIGFCLDGEGGGGDCELPGGVSGEVVI